MSARGTAVDETSIDFHPGPDCPRRGALEVFAAGAPVEESTSAHVHACERCRDFVRRLRGESVDLGPILRRLKETAATGDPSRMEDPERERVLVPGYRIIEAIGEGGQGTVYRAVQESTKQPVALKLLRAGRFATALQRARVEREAELVASLRHPGIVMIHDRLVTPGGEYAIVMEFIEGVPLDQWTPLAGRVEERRREALGVFVRICDAVAFAHRNGVIHRDLKPSNILVDAQGQPHLLDFGIAKAMDDRHVELTMTGDAMFTPAYASPEQVRREATDTRTDVYSLGVILYKLACGNLPYAVEGSLREIIESICERAPIRPRERDRSIHSDLETIILRALQKERSRRYGSVAELGEDVARYLERRPILAKRDSAAYVLGMWLRRHWRLTSLAVMVLSMLGATALIAAKNTIEASRLRERGRVSEERSAAATEVMRQVVEEVDPASSGGRSVRGRVQHMLIAADQAVTRQSPGALAAMSNEIALVAMANREYAAAESALEQTIRTRRRMLDPDDPSIAKARHDLAELYLLQGRSRLLSAEALAEESQRARRRVFGSTSPEHAESEVLLARIRMAQGRAPEARPMLARAARVLMSPGSEASARTIAQLRSTQGALVRDSDPTSAIAHYEAALRSCFDAHGDRHQATAKTMIELGQLLQRAPADASARERGARLERTGRHLGEIGSSSKSGVGATREQTPKVRLVDTLADLLRIKEEIYGTPLDPHLAETHVAIAIQWMIAKDLRCAAESFSNALPILRAASGETGDQEINCLEQIALCEGFVDARSEARVMAWERLAALLHERRMLDQEPEVGVKRLRSVAQAQLSRDRADDALRVLDLAGRLSNRVPFGVDTAELWEVTGWALVQTNRAEEGGRALAAAQLAYVDLDALDARRGLRIAARITAADAWTISGTGLARSLAHLGAQMRGPAEEWATSRDVREALEELGRALVARGDRERASRVRLWLDQGGAWPNVK